jgi:hypothetical protein
MQEATTAPKLAGADVAPQARPTFVWTGPDGKTGAIQIPQNHDQMMALMFQRRQLSDQLESVTDRRHDLIEEMRTVPQAALPGLQAQLAVLDARVTQLETDLARVGQEISMASPELIAMVDESRNPPPTPDEFAPGMAVGSVTTLAVLIGVYFFRRRGMKKRGLTSSPLMLAADSERLQRMEQGIDAMAVEIERISEGQRFVTKLLAEKERVPSA